MIFATYLIGNVNKKYRLQEDCIVSLCLLIFMLNADFFIYYGKDNFIYSKTIVM